MVWPIAKLILQRVALLVKESSRRIKKRRSSNPKEDENVNLPIFHLVTLFIKENIRPVVNRFSKSIKQNPQFRAVIERVAQRYNLMISRSQSILPVKQLSDEQAYDLGTKIVGETLVYAISAGLLLAEYRRSSKTDQIKEEKRNVDIATLQRKTHEHGMTTEEQDTQIKELKRKIIDLEEKYKFSRQIVFLSLISVMYNVRNCFYTKLIVNVIILCLQSFLISVSKQHGMKYQYHITK
ncbi:uncharacterized protein LOC127738643 [Mytilus californianus]|uniref:uncharacterized protein LOC127738643 n=1 Tax=Mytilus californianus TaxID=6549 RepID=UPI0022460AFB|nr:uncharacterized protein LOC127738643 [Mytilus californianus]